MTSGRCRGKSFIERGLDGSFSSLLLLELCSLGWKELACESVEDLCVLGREKTCRNKGDGQDFDFLIKDR